MNTPDLQMLATRTRFMREAGVALILASLVLGIFLFIPVKSQSSQAPGVAITAPETPNAFASVPIQAQAAIVYDLATKKVLYAKNADAQLPLASLTKLLTVYGALAKLNPETLVTVSAHAASMESPHKFAAGDTLALSELARLTLTGSLNDGATAIAETAAAAENHATSDMLASAATSLKLTQTYAVNGSGLDENPEVSGGYGSAYDVATLAGALLEKAPSVVLATTNQTTTGIGEDGTVYAVKNTNPTVDSTPRLLLSKTGFTDLAGGNLAVIFDAAMGHPIAVVVLGSTEEARFTDSQALVASTLAHFANLSSL